MERLAPRGPKVDKDPFPTMPHNVVNSASMMIDKVAEEMDIDKEVRELAESLLAQSLDGAK